MLATAKAAARAAGAIQRENFGKMLNVDAKMKNDIKLEVDRLCEEAIINTVLQVYPDHEFLAEEGGEGGKTDAEYVWIIDPLDGTVNYFYGLPYFCTSIACYRKGESGMLKGLGEPVLGVVYAPKIDEMFSAEVGGGAYLNDQKIRAAEVAELSECMVATGFGSTRMGIDRMLNGLPALVDDVRKMRCLGAAAYDICNVAAGRLTAFFEKGLHTWDIAAASIIAAEAGAVVDAFEYAAGRWDYIASAKGVHEKIAGRLREEAGGGND